MESSLRSDISRIYGRIGNDFMNQNETQWDKLLKIKTTGRDDSRSDQYRYPYEPTQYCVLERLANNGLITNWEGQGMFLSFLSDAMQIYWC